MIDRDRLRAAYLKTRAALLAERTPDGFWVGELSSSALATATAIAALKQAAPDETLIAKGLRWLVEHQNADGGWGDTVKSISNISTTMLCRAALYLCAAHPPPCPPPEAGGGEDRNVETERGNSLPPALRGDGRVGGEQPVPVADSLRRCEAWLFERYGNSPQELAEAVRQRYGKDRTFAVPILTMCALAGLVPWDEVPRLPFELACLPQSWYRFARLPVVSYALPALIAIGQCVHHHRGTWNPLTALARWLGRKRSLRVLECIQPSSGGYLEATPLTSFVVMSLAALNPPEGPARRVMARSVEFIRQSMRPDGSWPIDTNLSIWVTTLSINALAAAGDLDALDRKYELREWLLSQQVKERHPYTGAAPGGWGWSHLPGSVPDCDDTPGALLALAPLRATGVYELNGVKWITGLQNRDGGWPTFCRGWGALPFDRSGSDLTAHALRAISRFRCELPRDDQIPTIGLGELTQENVEYYFDSGFRYLSRHQRPDGSWLPLWFGNQHAPDDINPTYGTAKVLAAYRDLKLMDSDEARKGVAFLLSIQNSDGGWGGAKDTPSSIEETALAVEILIDAGESARPAVERGLEYLIRRVEDGTFTDAAPIGFYFAKLWYFEKLYPIIFTVAALGRGVNSMDALSSGAG